MCATNRHCWWVLFRKPHCPISYRNRNKQDERSEAAGSGNMEIDKAAKCHELLPNDKPINNRATSTSFSFTLCDSP